MEGGVNHLVISVAARLFQRRHVATAASVTYHHRNAIRFRVARTTPSSDQFTKLPTGKLKKLTIAITITIITDYFTPPLHCLLTPSLDWISKLWPISPPELFTNAIFGLNLQTLANFTPVNCILTPSFD